MSGDSAAGTLVEIKLKQLEREGKKVDEKQKKELYESVRATYEHQSDPRYAAARLWVDAIIDPAHTRDALIWALEAAALNPEIREFKTDRKSTRLNSSHGYISYAVFCLKKKNIYNKDQLTERLHSHISH